VVAGRAAKATETGSDADAGRQVAGPAEKALDPAYRRMLHFYAASNGLLLVGLCAGAWYLAGLSTHNGIPPNSAVGFRSPHAFATTQGWYAAQRTGFHIAAIAVTVVMLAMSAIVAVVYLRRLH